jgi:hypothetical protein
MLRSLEVAKTNDVTQALDQTIQVQPLRPLLRTQFHFATLSMVTVWYTILSS